MPRSAAEIVAATRPFARENPRHGWYYVVAALVMLMAALVFAAIATWPWRLIGSIVAGLVMVRVFILHHDYMHGAILRRSKLAKAIFYPYGIFVLTPPRSWRASHNFHHAQVGKIEASSTGSFRIMTTRMWREAPWHERLYYRFSRSPIVIVLAYPFVFLIASTLLPLLRNPRRHWDSALALAVHGGLIAGLWLWEGFAAALFVVIVPHALAGMIGAYLFYTQHNFVGMQILPAPDWSIARASLASSSYLRLGPVMRWITADIGYHHVHHLNAAIPFYRLAEAMQAIPELQNPITTTLRPRDIVAGMRLKLWDEDTGRMVGFRDAAAA